MSLVQAPSATGAIGDTIPHRVPLDSAAWTRDMLARSHAFLLGLRDTSDTSHPSETSDSTVLPFLLNLLATAEPVFCTDVCDSFVREFRLTQPYGAGPRPGPIA
jgi:hypothetical protein